MVETIDKEVLIQEIVSGIEKDGKFPDYTRIQLEAICDRYIIVDEDYVYSAVIINKDVSKGLSMKADNIFYRFKDCMDDIWAIVKSASTLNMQNSLKNIMIAIDCIFMKIMNIEEA